jgi:transposase
MDRQLERCCGLDVHKETIAACVRIGGRRGPAEQHVQTFQTTAADLVVLRDWLAAHGVTHVAMESTGVYWKPVFYALESDFTCLLVNAAHIKQVPGRKTDIHDCVWIAQLLEHGLLRGSFVPPAPIREVRDLTRSRKALIQDRTRVANRLHKALEDAGVKLATVASDILGVSGRAMLEALAQGTTDPTVLADLARGRLRGKLPALRAALAGRFRTHHVRVACFAAREPADPRVTIASTLRRTSSLARAGKRSSFRSAQRYSMTRLLPSSYPRSRRPWRSAPVWRVRSGAEV